MLSTIISSFESAEHVSIDPLMEQVVMMRVLGLIRDDAARCLLRFAVDQMGYNILIGRNVNFRPKEYTSILGSGKFFLFLKRLFSKEGDSVFKKIKEVNPIFVFLVHDALWHFDIYSDAFCKMKMIHIDRHPVDLVYSWFSKGYGADFTHNSSSGTVILQAEDKQLLYYTAGKEDEYSRMPEADRVIHMVKDLTDKHFIKYNSLSEEEKGKVKIVIFEKLVTDPEPVLKELTWFLSTKMTKHTIAVCRKQRCPRKLNIEDRENKFEKIKESCSAESFKILTGMTGDYELRNGLK